MVSWSPDCSPLLVCRCQCQEPGQEWSILVCCKEQNTSREEERSQHMEAQMVNSYANWLWCCQKQEFQPLSQWYIYGQSKGAQIWCSSAGEVKQETTCRTSFTFPFKYVNGAHECGYHLGLKTIEKWCMCHICFCGLFSLVYVVSVTHSWVLKTTVRMEKAIDAASPMSGLNNTVKIKVITHTT